MARRIKVASIYTSLIVGGDTSRLLAYLGARDRDRFDHVVFGGMTPSREWQELCGPVRDRFRDVGVEVVDVGLPVRHLEWRTASPAARALQQLGAFARLVRRTARALRDNEIDIVDARLEMGTVVGAAAGRLARVKAVISTKYTPWTGGERWYQRRCPPPWALLGQSVYASVDAVVCDSVTGLEAIRRGLVFPPAGYCVPNGVEPPRAERTREELSAEFGIPSEAKVIAQIARLQPTKGQHLLVEAAPLVLARRPDAFFLLVGYPGHTQAALDYRSRLHEMIQKQRLSDRIRMVSYPGNVGDIWSLVDVHAHPTLVDSSPIALLEGMSLGKPAVTTRVGGIPELVVDGETGIVLPPGDAPALAAAILRLLQRPDEAAQLGRNARRRYETGYTPAVMARRIEDVFERVYAAPRIRRRAFG